MIKAKAYDPANGGVIGDYVYATLREDILHMELKPGDKLSEHEISKALGVSRTPVRESFIKLAKEGVVHVSPQRGTYISKIKLDRFEEARFIRRNLERAVFIEAVDRLNPRIVKRLEAKLVEQKELLDYAALEKSGYAQFLQRDDEFHRMIYQVAGRERTWQLIQQISLDYERIRLLSYALDFKLVKTYQEHCHLLQLLKDNKGDELLTVLDCHLLNVKQEVVELVRLFPEYFE